MSAINIDIGLSVNPISIKNTNRNIGNLKLRITASIIDSTIVIYRIVSGTS
jgi:hypothetical protein